MEVSPKFPFIGFPPWNGKEKFINYGFEICKPFEKNFFPSKTSVICSKHFTPQDFNIGDNSTRITLKYDAIPTIFDGITPLMNSATEDPIDRSALYTDAFEGGKKKKAKRELEEPIYEETVIITSDGQPVTIETHTTSTPMNPAPTEDLEVYEEVIDSKSSIIQQIDTTGEEGGGGGGGEVKKIIVTNPDGTTTTRTVQMIYPADMKTDESGSVIISQAPVFVDLNGEAIEFPTPSSKEPPKPPLTLRSDQVKPGTSKKILIKSMKAYEKKIDKLHDELRKAHDEKIKLMNELKSFKGCTNSNNLLTEINSRGLTNTVKSEKGHRKPLNKPFSTELETFAVNLYNKSPKAYRYIRKALNSALPSVSYIKKYRRKNRVAQEVTPKTVTSISETAAHEIVVGRFIETTDVETQKTVNVLGDASTTQYVETIAIS